MNLERGKLFTICAIIAVLGFVTGSTFAVTVDLDSPSGLGATATFTLIGPMELEVVLTNTSTGVPYGFNNSDQLLTGISFDLSGPQIIGGTVVIGPDIGDHSLNFDIGPLGNGADVSSEWGYGNSGSTGMLANMVSTNVSHMVPFSNGLNLDGPASLDGPQGGLIADPVVVYLGEGLGAIQNSIVITLNLGGDGLRNMSFLDNGVIAEFGSDAAFIPEPATICLLGLGSLSLIRRWTR